MTSICCYEQPLNELVRLALRFEHLYGQIEHHWRQINFPQDSRVLLKLITDLVNLVDRPDLKSKLNQEFHRMTSVLTRLHRNPAIDPEILASTVDALRTLSQGYLNTRGKPAESLRVHEFLTVIRQDLLTPAGDSPINDPHYFYWLNQPISLQREQIQTWLIEFQEMKRAISLLLDIIRRSSEPKTLVAEKGFYYQALDTQASLQLLQVLPAADQALFPEISAGKHRMSIRWMIPNSAARPQQTSQNVLFSLKLCVI